MSRFYTIIDRMNFIQKWMKDNNFISFGDLSPKDELKYEADYDKFFKGKRYLDKVVHNWKGNHK